jgi:hypothetical protein
MPGVCTRAIHMRKAIHGQFCKVPHTLLSQKQLCMSMCSSVKNVVSFVLLPNNPYSVQACMYWIFFPCFGIRPPGLNTRSRARGDTRRLARVTDLLVFRWSHDDDKIEGGWGCNEDLSETLGIRFMCGTSVEHFEHECARTLHHGGQNCKMVRHHVAVKHCFCQSWSFCF